MNANKNGEMKMKCEIGDTVTYRTIMGRIRTVVVTGIGEKDGSPVFDGDMNDGSLLGLSVWGYEEDIISVTSKAA